MDAKSKANFINSVAAGQTIPCPNCGTANEPDSKHCISCGAELSPPAAASAPAFAQISEEPQQQPRQEPQQKTEKPSRNTEPTPVFADGLPSWDIVPPQVMVRRH